jgi:ribosome biogenesis GTPase
LKLEDFGWTPILADHFRSHAAPVLTPARVATTYTHLYRLLTVEGETMAAVSGRFRHEARGQQDFPATGDFVAMELRPGDERATIQAVMPRSTCFSRKAPGTRAQEQVVAANIDTVFLTAGLDGDFNPRRWSAPWCWPGRAGRTPSSSSRRRTSAPTSRQRGRRWRRRRTACPSWSRARRPEKAWPISTPTCLPGRTVALLGSSGTGKSTLVNRLLGYDKQRTLAVRESDDRGRHTTTHRELIPLPSGALVIDTPGLREIQLWAGEASLGEAFSDIAAFAETCRFRDCQHKGEPGCGVAAALADGRLDAARLESHRRLGKELRFLAVREDVGLQQAQKARWKSIHKQARNHRPRG